MAEVEGRSASAMGRAWERLAARRSFRGAAATLLVIASLAVYAPFLANDRPYVLEGVRRGEYERALRSLAPAAQDRKSTRLNSRHRQGSYAVCCLEKKEL